MKQSRFPKGWDEDRVKRVLDHYENQTEDEAVAEDEAAGEDTSHFFIEVPNELVPADENVNYLPAIMASADFSSFTLQRPGAIMRPGCSNPGKGFIARLHSPYFDIDEQVPGVGVAIYSAAVIRFLS